MKDSKVATSLNTARHLLGEDASNSPVLVTVETHSDPESGELYFHITKTEIKAAGLTVPAPNELSACTGVVCFGACPCSGYSLTSYYEALAALSRQALAVPAVLRVLTRALHCVMRLCGL